MIEIDPEGRIVLTSGFTRDENIDEMNKQGLAAFIEKPFSDIGLFRVIEQVLGN